MTKQFFKISVAVASAFSFSACDLAASSGLYDTSSAEVAGGTIASAAASSDSSSGTTVAYTVPERSSSSVLTMLAKNLLVPPSLASACPALSACSGNALALNGCSGLVGTWTGSFGLAFTGGSATCGTALSAYTNGEAFTLTSSSGVVLTIGNYTLTNTSGNSGFNNIVSGGTTVACTATGCTSRTVTVSGWNRILAYSSVPVYNHTVNTSSPFAIAQSGTAKTISSGTLVLQHNLAHFVATTTVSQPVVITGGCCVPTSGSLTTTFSNGKTGTETVNFGPTCGSGTVNGHSFTLAYCQ
jgi:hypothetical protein